MKLSIPLAVGAVLAMGFPIATPGPALGQEWTDPVLPVFADDVEGQFAALARRPDGLGFSLGGSPNPRMCKHYQGIVRVNGPDGTPYMLLTRSGNATITCPPGSDDDPGNLLIVKMRSRDKNGERLRSNRFERDWPINGFFTSINDFLRPTPPATGDSVRKTIFFDGTDVWPNYGHPGAMQVIDDVLVLAMEGPYDEGLPESQIMFIDVSDPENPSLLSFWEPPDISSDFTTGLVGIAPILIPSSQNATVDCCSYVMVATGKINTILRFYRSMPTEPDGSTDLRSGSLEWEETGSFSERMIEGCLNEKVAQDIDWHTGIGDAHQMFNLIREGGIDGPLYMIATRNDTKFSSGDDRMDLYRINLLETGAPVFETGTPPPGTTLPCFIELVDSGHFTSKPFMGGGDSANFGAAAGTYLSPSGALIVYAAEYENDGPIPREGTGEGDRQTVRFVEYRNPDMVPPHSPTLRPRLDVAPAWEVDEGSSVTLSASGEQAITKAWIQTYEGAEAGTVFPGGDAWLAVDFVDRDADDFDAFFKLRFGGVFNGQATSWRWFAPEGCTIRANDLPITDDDFPGDNTQLLLGTGAVVVELNLGNIDFNDDMRSVTFLPDCSTYYGAAIEAFWDLDYNGIFETDGASTVFDAASLDGPADIPVAARAQHPTDTSNLGTGDPVFFTVRVKNVAPTIVTLDVSDSGGNQLNTDLPVTLAGLPLSLAATFTDPGLADTQTASLDWDDGTVETSFDSFSDASGGATGALGHGHTFSDPGSRSIELTVTDDDGGAASAYVKVEVVSAGQAIEAAVDLLVTELAASPGPDVAAALQKAIDWLIGNIGGQADNGALDELDAGNTVEAITHIISAIEEIKMAEAAGGPDLSAIKDLLGLSAESLAVSLLAEAETALDPPSKGQLKQLGSIQALIDAGHSKLLAGNQTDASQDYRQAAKKAISLLG